MRGPVPERETKNCGMHSSALGCGALSRVFAALVSDGNGTLN